MNHQHKQRNFIVGGCVFLMATFLGARLGISWDASGMESMLNQYKVKIVNDSDEDLIVRFMSAIGASPAFAVRAHHSIVIPESAGPTAGEKIWGAFRAFEETVYAFDKVVITGNTKITITADKKFSPSAL